MSSCNVVAQVVSHIIKQGKEALHDHFLRKEKVPTYANRAGTSHTQQIIIHNGYQAEISKKYSHLALRKDNPPQFIAKDGFATKSTQVSNSYKSFIQSPITYKSSNHKVFSSKKRNRENSSFSANKSFHGKKQEVLKQKDIQLIKLNQNFGNRIVVERAKLRDESQQDAMRDKKRARILRQYEQKLSNEAFQKQRIQKQIAKQKILDEHLKKSNNHGFNFDNDGQLILFESSNKIYCNFPPQANFKIKGQQNSLETSDLANPRQNILLLQKNSQDQLVFLAQNPKINENQRIRSARGEAFASAVMKTMNLSRISVNGSLADIDIDQFMKRNDLFNNNHSRQTSSIPYLQPKAGTVYTEVATNQAIKSNNHPQSTTVNQRQSFEIQLKDLPQKIKHFQSYSKSIGKNYPKTARISVQDDISSKSYHNSVRPIKTTQQGVKRGWISERRPKTSVNRGRITTANELLVQNLLIQ